MRTLALLIGLMAAMPAAAADRPVLVELFTSQGCSSCPPADAFLGELAKRTGGQSVLALSHHVTYWDRLGWPDPFALKASTDRQYAYRQRFQTRYVYTPQMVVDGVAEGVGSDRATIDAAIHAARRSLDATAMTTRRDGAGLTVALGAHPVSGPHEVLVLGFDPRHETMIARGENGGRRLAYHNVVRGIARVGAYDGRAGELRMATAGLPPGERLAVIVQAAGLGPVLAATVVE